MGFISDLRRRTEIDDYAKTLADQFAKRLPSARQSDAKKVATEVGIAVAHAQGFQRNTKLGVIGKSRLANTFQWELVEHGYTVELAREIGRELASKMASRSRAAPVSR